MISIARTLRRLPKNIARRRCLGTSTNSEPRKRKVVFSGIQPTGIPHLGNYLGAFQNWLKLQRDSHPDDQLIFSIVGWHALTLPQDPKALLQSRNDMLAVLLAIGLDPKRCIIFHQDENPDHPELAWILSCLTPFGKLRRMTTWKSRLAVSRNANNEAEIDESLLNTGLFTYPVLQAADILAYKATNVPVGEDQQQHLELTRDIAEGFNKAVSRELFPLPEYGATASKRILSLRDPTAKMSKSAADSNSRILLTDDYQTIRRKVRSAVTDSTPGVTFDPENRPGTSNLISILAGCTGEDATAVARRYSDKGHGYLKNDVVEAVEEMLKEPRSELLRLKSDQAYLKSISEQGSREARQISSRTMEEVRRLVGLSI
ncbi:tryptophanyl-tRNA synthetase [Schizopora paradoxa]|uniref:Tryptophan--tRNA ligase, mitochondrial n=1 Tax=Schizopora paradoxa TaxID=27342 RepID=A0A0H2S6P7_9AGAM|nr:tryptophanyl-tRNA synthetase [Schizopora paradoxa]